MSEAYTESLAAAAAAGTTVVLPSEIAAEFWRRELVRGRMRAIREDRVVSWDRFKEQAFDLRTDRLPANRTIRALFVERLLHENARSPFLRRIVPPASAANADGFRAQLTRTLPALPQSRSLEQIVGRAGDVTTDGLQPLLSDLAELDRRYTAFLDDHGLFEPAWLERSPAYQGGDHVLVMPELAEDFAEFEAALAGVARVAVPVGALPRLVQYPDSRCELESTLGEIATLLDSGVAPESIVLTVCDLDAVRLRLTQAAEVADVPLTVRQGVPLSRSAPGRFFAAIADVVGSGFGLEPLKRFLLNRAVPWVGFAANARLVVAGARAGCLGGRSRPDPRWRRIGPSPERDLIDLLMRELPRLTRAASAAELRDRWNRLRDRLVDSAGWSAADEMLLQRCVVGLNELVDFEARHEMRIESPYRFWMDRLAEQLYVPRGADRGVAVLPYRVGAAVYPDHHFVIGASNAATRVRIARYPFLTDAERDTLGETAADHDQSDAFARAYAVSGRRVVVSCSRTTWDGPALPPGEYVAHGTIGDPTPGVSPFAAWAAEEEVGGVLPSRVYRLQQQGAAEYARAGAGRPGVDLTREPISRPDLIEGVLLRQRHRRRPELVSISAADLQAFRACPFSYLLSRGLALDELAYEVDPDSAADIGSLYHRALERFFDGLREAGERFDAARLDEYRARLGEIVERESAPGPGMVPAFVYAARQPLAERVFDRLLEHDAKMIGGHAIESIEAWEDRPELETGVYLVGRIDRVTRGADGSLTLVDYKKRTLPTQKAQHAGSADATGVSELPPQGRADERDRVESVQIPFYVRLLESRGEHVGTAAYYSLEEGSPLVVMSEDPDVGKTVMTRERMDEVLVLLDDIVRETVRRIFAGDYACGEGCDGCAYRGVCRAKFLVR